MSGVKLFQAEETVISKAQKSRRPWRVCRVEASLASWKPGTAERDQQVEKL